MHHCGTPRLVALCGSLRDESRTRIATRTALDAGRAAGADTELLDLRSYALPPLHAVDSPPVEADRLRATVDDADAVLLATPNYHGSYSGALKTALDYCGREEFAGTTVGLLEVAAGRMPGSALRHLRTVSRTLDAWPLPTEVAVPDSHSLVTDAGVADDDVSGRLRRLGRELVDYAGVAQFPAVAGEESAAAVGGGTDE